MLHCVGRRLGRSDTGLSKCGHRSEVRGVTKWARRGSEWAENNSQAKEHNVLHATRVNDREVVSIVLASKDNILMIHARKVFTIKYEVALTLEK